jgi:4-hydroxy-tetrahydrodipicolinate reductase
MKVGIWGICGKMGKMLYKTIKETEGFETIFGVDKNIELVENISIYNDECCNVKEKPDVIIDFSHRSSTTRLLSQAVWFNCPLVICSTGQTTEDLIEIYSAAKSIPIMLTPNTTLGSAFLINTTKKGADFFGENNYQIDISETHSAEKKDAPSGTAITLLNAVLSLYPSLQPIYLWQNQVPRKNNQISVTSKRMGDVIGEHEISFAKNGEILTIKHQVLDRKIFAQGALECAKFIADKPAGLYRMEDMIKPTCKNCSCKKIPILDNQK